MAKILIDGRFVGVGESMTRYTLEVLRGVLMLDPDNEYTLLIRPQGEGVLEDYPGVIAAPNLKIDVLDIPHYSLPEQTKLLKYLNPENFDLVHFIQFNHPIYYKKTYVVTVHDLTMVGYLHRSNPIKRAAFSKVMKSAVMDSKKVITISNQSKREIVDYYHVDPQKIEVIYNGVDSERYRADLKLKTAAIQAFSNRHGIQGDYLLYTGAWKKHKNLLRLLKAFEEYQKASNPPIQLVLVGKPDDHEPEVKSEIERINHTLSPLLLKEGQGVVNNTAIKQYSHKPIITTGYIEESDLPLVYAGAKAYAIPSLSEGFGLPPLEAMACGTPVISSKESCMPEILDGAAYYFDPYDIKDMASAIEKILNDNELRQMLTKRGLEQVKKYSWNTAAKETLGVYKEILS